MQTQSSERYTLAVLITIVGGFLESYSYITRNGVFANAQTGNIARVGLSLAAGDLSRAGRYLVPVLAFVVGVTLSVQIRKTFQNTPKRWMHWRQFVILVELVLVIFVGFFPVNTYNVAATVTISFICALQVESFRKFYGNTFASTMCTGNLRIATENLNMYWNTHNRAHLKKSLLYYTIDLMFIVGVILGYFCTHTFGCRAIWFCLFPLSSVFCLMMHRPQRTVESLLT